MSEAALLPIVPVQSLVLRPLRFLLCRLSDCLGEAVRQAGRPFVPAVRFVLFLLLPLPRIDLALRDLPHVLALDFALLAVMIREVLRLAVLLLE